MSQNLWGVIHCVFLCLRMSLSLSIYGKHFFWVLVPSPRYSSRPVSSPMCRCLLLGPAPGHVCATPGFKVNHLPLIGIALPVTVWVARLVTNRLLLLFMHHGSEVLFVANNAIIAMCLEVKELMFNAHVTVVLRRATVLKLLPADLPAEKRTPRVPNQSPSHWSWVMVRVVELSTPPSCPPLPVSIARSSTTAAEPARLCIGMMDATVRISSTCSSPFLMLAPPPSVLEEVMLRRQRKGPRIMLYPIYIFMFEG